MQIHLLQTHIRTLMNEIFDIVVIGFAFLLLARHNLSELWILLLLRSSVVVVFRVLFAFLGAWWHGDERNEFRRDR